MDRSAKTIGILAALIAGILWGFLGPAVRGCMDIGLTPMQMTCLRYIVVTAILLIYVLGFKREALKTTRFQFILFIIIAVVGVMCNSTLYFESMLLIPLSMSTVLQYLAPFIVVAVSVPLFREPLDPPKIAAVLMAFIGCILCTGLISEPGSMDTWGIIVGAASGFCYACYIICSKRLTRDRCPTTTILFYSSIISVIGLAPLCDLPSAIGVMASSPSNILLIIMLGVFLTLAPFWLFNYSLSKIEAGTASIITFVEPLVATLVGFTMYSEGLTAEAAIGMTLILLALITINRRNEPSGSE